MAGDAAGKPLVSVVVRSMARPSLAATLASLAAQTYAPLEILVVAALGAAHPAVQQEAGPHAVRLVPSDEPLPRPAAANAGLEAARGEWITFLDDDDLFLPDHIEGLMAARAHASAAGVVHCFADARFRDGRRERFGQPHATTELYERNYLHLSTAVVHRRLLAEGCRFDPTLDVHEDWDFFIQLGRHTRFHFVPRASFIWNADAGTSGAGGGSNQDDTRFAVFRDRVYAKWASAHDALVDRVTATLGSAAERLKAGDRAGAEARCMEVLRFSQNDPSALNLLAMARRAAQDLAGARAAQALAVVVRPHDVALVQNLALLYVVLGDVAAARQCCDRALLLDPGYALAQRLKQQLEAR